MSTDSILDTTIDNQLSSYDADLVKIRQIINCIAKGLTLSCHELSIVFVESETMTDLNNQYRQINKPTDVLSFPQIDWAKPWVVGDNPIHKPAQKGPIPQLGDIVIALEEAEKNADSIGHELDREVCFLLVHGILHLCGHDHDEAKEEELMLEQQRIIMDMIESEKPRPWLNCVSKRHTS